MSLTGYGRIRREEGDRTLIYVQQPVARDSAWPFSHRERVRVSIEVKKQRVIVERIPLQEPAHRPPLTALFALLLLAFSGCANPGDIQASPFTVASGPAVGSVSVTPSTDAVTAEEFATIRGVVTNDEMVPLPGAAVTVRTIDAHLLTDSDGRFEFTGVPPGRYVLEVQAVGHLPQAKPINPQAAEEISVAFVLAPLPVDEPYLEVFPFTQFMELQAANGLMKSACANNCTWFIPMPVTPDHVFFEAYGRHSISNPARPDGLEISAHKNGLGDGGYIWNCNWSASPTNTCLQLPVKFAANRSKLMSVDPVDVPPQRLSVFYKCDPYWFCLDERIETWVTFFHRYDAIPDGYSARPD